MKEYGCCPMHHGTKMCKSKKKLTKMAIVYELSILVKEEEEIPYPS